MWMMPLHLHVNQKSDYYDYIYEYVTGCLFNHSFYCMAIFDNKIKNKWKIFTVMNDKVPITCNKMLNSI